MRDHIVIGDVQDRPGRPREHLTACGNLIVERKPEVVVCIGDFADMASISTYNSLKQQEGSRVLEDIESARGAMEALLKPIKDYNDKQRAYKKKLYQPEYHFTLGNHEHRINRYIDNNPSLEGMISIDQLGYKEFGWTVHDYQDIVVIDGVAYSHFFINPWSARKGVQGGTIATKIKNIGYSFTMGHQQNYQRGRFFNTLGKEVSGLVLGAFYMHDEDYMGPQGNSSHFRGIGYKHDVSDGSYDLEEFSVSRLIRNYL